MTDRELLAVEDIALSFANRMPDWTLENSEIKLRIANRRYFVIDEVDASRLEALRKMIILIIEERRKRETQVES